MAQWSEWEPARKELQFQDVLYEKKYRLDKGGAVAKISSNRPEKMNALTNVGFNEMTWCVRDASADPEVAVIVMAAVGDHFGVGGDVSWEASGGLDPQKQIQAGAGFTVPNGAIGESLKPVIAAIQGYAIGGHHHMAYACDFTIAADDAVLGQNGPRVGSPVGGALVAQLAHVVGLKKASEIWMLLDRYNAFEAKDMGLINKVVPRARLEREVLRWCDELMDISPTIMSSVKQSYQGVGSYLNGIPRPLVMLDPLFHQGAEVKEAQRAFFEKRPARYWPAKGETQT